MKKPVVAFTVADKNNERYAQMLENSLRKFHSEEELPFIVYKGDKLASYTKDDPDFFYRQKPIISEELIQDYELVIGLDADQIICDDISYLWNTKDYDVAYPLNYNVPDAQQYGLIQGWGIHPVEYANCGLVSVRNLKFIHEWKVWCFSPQFARMQFREQDGLNIKIHHGNWNCRGLDHGDGPAKMHSFWGLFSKTYWLQVFLKDNKLTIPANPESVPRVETTIKVLHWGGGNNGVKMNYKTVFNEEVSKRLDYLVSEGK